MNAIIKFFDYSFYRISKIYDRWDGKASSTATVVITLVQVLFLTEPFMFLYFKFLDYKTRQEYKDIGAIILLAALFLLFYINDRRYQRIYNSLESKFSNEQSKRKIINLVLVVVVFLIPIILPFIVIPIV